MSIEDFKAIVEGSMCKGVNPGYLAKSHHNHLNDMPPNAYLVQCYTLVGKDAKFPRLASAEDTSDTYAKALRESGDWEEIVPVPGEDFYPLLEDHDLLTWALSPDGTGGCNEKPGLNGGNTTTGFLIKAEGDYPVAWVSPDINTPSGVYPLAKCLTLEKRKGSGLKAKLIYIHRRVE